MFYCTIYTQAKLSDKSTCEVFICLSYQNKNDAESYQQKLIQQAIDVGGNTYLTEGNYITLTGKLLLKPTGMTSSRRSNHYIIGVESDSTKFSIIPVKAKSLIPGYKIADGLAYELYVEEATQRQLAENLARQDETGENIKKFASEIKPMTDLHSVLRAFIKYSNKKTNKEVLTAIAIGKIQELI